MGESSDYSSQKTRSMAADDARDDAREALAYMKAVLNKFADDPKKFQEFVELIKDLNRRTDSVHHVRKRAWELFKGHKELILGFNAFLPKGSELSVGKSPCIIDFEVAIAFVNKVKMRFIEHDEHTYKSFLDVLSMYRNDHKSISETQKEIVDLLGDQNDLIEEFSNFLPFRDDSSPKPNYEKMVSLFQVLSLHDQEQVPAVKTEVKTEDDQIMKEI